MGESDWTSDDTPDEVSLQMASFAYIGSVKDLSIEAALRETSDPHLMKLLFRVANSLQLGERHMAAEYRRVVRLETLVQRSVAVGVGVIAILCVVELVRWTVF